MSLSITIPSTLMDWLSYIYSYKGTLYREWLFIILDKFYYRWSYRNLENDTRTQILLNFGIKQYL